MTENVATPAGNWSYLNLIMQYLCEGRIAGVPVTADGSDTSGVVGRYLEKHLTPTCRLAQGNTTLVPACLTR